MSAPDSDELINLMATIRPAAEDIHELLVIQREMTDRLNEASTKLHSALDALDKLTGIYKSQEKISVDPDSPKDN